MNYIIYFLILKQLLVFYVKKLIIGFIYVTFLSIHLFLFVNSLFLLLSDLFLILKKIAVSVNTCNLCFSLVVTTEQRACENLVPEIEPSIYFLDVENTFYDKVFRIEFLF